MSRTPYDQVAKVVLESALEGAGTVERQAEARFQTQWVDVSFEREPSSTPTPSPAGSATRRHDDFALLN